MPKLDAANKQTQVELINWGGWTVDQRFTLVKKWIVKALRILVNNMLDRDSEVLHMF